MNPAWPKLLPLGHTVFVVGNVWLQSAHPLSYAAFQQQPLGGLWLQLAKTSTMAALKVAAGEVLLPCPPLWMHCFLREKPWHQRLEKPELVSRSSAEALAWARTEWLNCGRNFSRKPVCTPTSSIFSLSLALLLRRILICLEQEHKGSTVVNYRQKTPKASCSMCVLWR